MTIINQYPSGHQHLSDDQLEDFLLGEATADAAAHMAACPLCDAKRKAFASLMTDFNQATLAWASARPEHLPRSLAAPSRRRLFTAPAYAFAAMLLVLLTLLFTRWSPPSSFQSTQQPAALQQLSAGQVRDHPGPDPQIAADNNLLAAIDSALYESDPAQPDASPATFASSLSAQPDSASAR